MGAHNPATLAAARERIGFLRDKLNPLSSWHATLGEILDRGHVSGSIRAWIAEGRELETLQVDIELADGAPARIYAPWVPGARICDHAGASFMHLNGSRRDFRGMVTFAATPEYWVGFSDSVQRDSITLIVYRVLS